MVYALVMSTPKWPLVILPLALGWTSGWVAQRGPYLERQRTRSSDLQPPGWVFGVVWPILYLMMGWALFRMASLPRNVRKKATWAFVFFGIQMILNVAWSPIHTNVKPEEVSTALIYAILIAASATTVGFAQFDTVSGGLLLPYLAWLVFASYLSCESIHARAKPDDVPFDGRPELT